MNPINTPVTNRHTVLRVAGLFALAAVGSAVAVLAVAGPAGAKPKTCFGKKVNQVVRAEGRTVRLDFGDVAWIQSDRTTVIGAPFSRICADAGRQTVRTGKGRTMTSTGAGDDRIFIGKGSNSIADAGLGNDTVIGSKGHDFIYASPKRNPRSLPDRDTVRGAGGNDRIFDYAGEGNMLFGESGVDTIRSEDAAVSTLNGGDGNDMLFSDGGREGVPDRMLGERGNDRLNGNLMPSDGPVFLNGGSGDDWLNGGSFPDTAIANSGIVKIDTGGGDDLILAASAGRITMDGGDGSDTVSWAPHTPSGTRSFSGVRVDLGTGQVSGVGAQTVDAIENVIGSSFDDRITGAPGVENVIEAGIGDDELIGQYEDFGDGGLGTNSCSGFNDPLNCDGESPGGSDRSRLLVDVRSGVLTVMGSLVADEVGISWADDAYLVETDTDALVSDTCSTTQVAGKISCPARASGLSGMLVYGNDGDDSLTIDGSVPPFVTATMDGGDGANTMNGGPTRDFMTVGEGSEGTVMYGNGNADQLVVSGDVSALGGPDSDVLNSDDPCAGGRMSGGPGNDNAVFAGADRGVKADLAAGYARAVSGTCDLQLEIAGDVESLEGSRFDDVLILGRKLPQQGPKRSLLGREGINVLNSRNGSRDTVTTGPDGRKNEVIADPSDKVIYGWGFAAF